MTSTNIVAALKAGNVAKRIAITDMSMKACLARVPFAINRAQVVTLQLFEPKGNGKYAAYSPITAFIDLSIPRTSGRTQLYEAKIKFNVEITAAHGVAQTIAKLQAKPVAQEEQAIAEKAEEIMAPQENLECKNSSLYVIPVRCHMCGQEHIPFRALQSRTMMSKVNIFGMPQFTEALPGKEFCDYNLLRVTVCPSCYFASGEVNDFVRENSRVKDTPDPFERDAVLDEWNATIGERGKIIAKDVKGFFSEERSFEQALLSYDLAVKTCETLLKTEEQKKEVSRNYEFARRATAYLLVKAELLMSHKRSQEAEKLLPQVLANLAKIFPFLKRESSIKAAFHMGMLGLYLENSKAFSQSLTFLQQYSSNNKVRVGTEEHKTLTGSLKKLTEAYQNRGAFSRKQLKGFNRPF